jgi:hypothetical protein
MATPTSGDRGAYRRKPRSRRRASSCWRTRSSIARSSRATPIARSFRARR